VISATPAAAAAATTAWMWRTGTAPSPRRSRRADPPRLRRSVSIAVNCGNAMSCSSNRTLARAVTVSHATFTTHTGDSSSRGAAAGATGS
jgi:hypothetical protein